MTMFPQHGKSRVSLIPDQLRSFIEWVNGRPSQRVLDAKAKFEIATQSAADSIKERNDNDEREINRLRHRTPH